MNKKFLLSLLFAGALLGFLIYYNLSHAQAIEVPNPDVINVEGSSYDYTIPKPEVTAEQVGRTNTTISVQVIFKIPEGVQDPYGDIFEDAYGFVIDKEGSNGRRDQAAVLYPYERGFYELTGGGFYYDEAVVIGDTYTYYVKAYDRAGKESEWASAQVKLEGIAIEEITVTDKKANSATINWKTDGNTQARVEYGLTNTYGQASATTETNFEHSVTLTGLEVNKTYHYRIKVFPPEEDEENSWSVSGDNIFKTTSNPLVIALTKTDTTQTTADIDYTTSLNATTKFEYRIAESTEAYLSATTNASKTHNINLRELKPGQNYQFKITATNVDDKTDIATQQGNFVTPCIVLNNFNLDNNIDLPNVILTWQTSEAYDGTVRYKKTTEDNNAWQEIPFSGADVRVVLPNLQPGITYQYEVRPYQSEGSCIAGAGQFTMPTLQHSLTVQKVEGDKASFHWVSNYPTQGSLQLVSYKNDAFGRLIKTISDESFEVPESRDQIITKTIKFDSFTGMSTSTDPRYAGDQLFYATSNAISNDITVTSRVDSSAHFPNCLVLNTDFAFPNGAINTLNNSITVANSCSPTIPLSEATIAYELLDNVGGYYQSAQREEQTVTLTSNQATFILQNIWRPYYDTYSFKLLSMKSAVSGQVFTSDPTSGVVLPTSSQYQMGILSSTRRSSPRSVYLDELLSGGSLNINDNGSFTIHTAESLYAIANSNSIAPYQSLLTNWKGPNDRFYFGLGGYSPLIVKFSSDPLAHGVYNNFHYSKPYATSLDVTCVKDGNNEYWYRQYSFELDQTLNTILNLPARDPRACLL